MFGQISGDMEQNVSRSPRYLVNQMKTYDECMLI